MVAKHFLSLSMNEMQKFIIIFPGPTLLYELKESFTELSCTVTCQINVHNLANSIDFDVFSCLQEKVSCVSWSTYFHNFGAS